MGILAFDDQIGSRLSGWTILTGQRQVRDETPQFAVWISRLGVKNLVPPQNLWVVLIAKSMLT